MNICMIGTGLSGKTCYLYMMIRRLLIDCPRDFCANKRDMEVMKRISNKGWPDRTDLLNITSNRLDPAVIHLSMAEDDDYYDFYFPDLSGDVWEGIAEIPELARKASNTSIFDLLPKDLLKTPKELILPMKHMLTCNGYLLFLDLQKLADSEAEWHEHLSVTLGVLLMFREKMMVHDSREKLKRPILVIVGKSDIPKFKSKIPGMFERGQTVKDFLMEHGGEDLIDGINNLFRQDCIEYAFHSSVGAVYTAGKNKGEPNYQKCYKLPLDQYTDTFLDFLERLND